MIRKSEQPLKVLAVFFVVSTIADFYAVITSGLGINNLNILHIYTILECSFFILFYYTLLKKPAVRTLLLLILVTFVAFAIYHSFFLANLFEFNSVTRVMEAFILTGCGMYFFYTLFADDGYVNLKRFPYFYINSGVLLYFMGNIFLFMVYKWIITPASGNADIWTLHSVINIVANMLYCAGFLCNLRLRK